ncbi:hypothetical protein Q1695_003544 [Nippostrongylus brasiliensis]|nr:hypothetical protein Q1695_003544 [Nippostrongylus brasiliensis]
MKILASLFVLLSTAELAFSTEKCGLSEEDYDLLMKAHTNMNLTLDCDAVTNAKWGAHLMLENKGTVENFPNPLYWCKYSRYMFTYEGYRDWKERLWKDMPLNMIEETARLHPNTIYGCALDKKVYIPTIYAAVDHTEYALFCLYQKLAPEQRCV